MRLLATAGIVILASLPMAGCGGDSGPYTDYSCEEWVSFDEGKRQELVAEDYYVIQGRLTVEEGVRNHDDFCTVDPNAVNPMQRTVRIYHTADPSLE